jgi:para-aminobenzoate synthetase/4-amino-4-deoxychorismate lyase
MSGHFAQIIPRDFTLIESLLFEKGSGYFLLERHLDRFAHSAHYFGFQFDPGPVRMSLEKCSHDISKSSKVRLLLSRDGSVAVEVSRLFHKLFTMVTFADNR